jgi:hypothetical protein
MGATKTLFRNEYGPIFTTVAGGMQMESRLFYPQIEGGSSTKQQFLWKIPAQKQKRKAGTAPLGL